MGGGHGGGGGGGGAGAGVGISGCGDVELFCVEFCTGPSDTGEVVADPFRMFATVEKTFFALVQFIIMISFVFLNSSVIYQNK